MFIKVNFHLLGLMINILILSHSNYLRTTTRIKLNVKLDEDEVKLMFQGSKNLDGSFSVSEFNIS